MLQKNPQFQQGRQQLEMMFVPKQNILDQCIKKQLERICYGQNALNKLIYDSKQKPQYSQQQIVKLSNQEQFKEKYRINNIPYYIPTSKTDRTLVFQSRFQSGNLRRAIQMQIILNRQPFEYSLILRQDFYTQAHTQWYFFSVANTRKDIEYRFNFLNMMKPDSLYNTGMKPLIYSVKQYNETRWHRDGYDICYYQNQLKRKNGGFYYSLVFKIKFKYNYDTVYIAHCFPYTYSKLQSLLNKLQTDLSKKSFFIRKTLCTTIAGNNCDYVIITDFHNFKQKKGVFITSRVHPGQSMTSYVVQYIILFLCSNSPVAKILRQNFIFKIIPMLNIDGVINGNYRCNLAGVDLNRQWIQPQKKTHPTIYNAKNLLKKFMDQRELLGYFDFHGHSRKRNVFIYGCGTKDRKQQIFPMLLSKICPVFSLKDCCFTTQKDREGSARIALWKQFNILNCFTLQISFSGADTGKYQYFHFNFQILKQISQNFCQTILDYTDPDQKKVNLMTEELKQIVLLNQKNEMQGQDDSDYQTQQIIQELQMKNKKK